MVLKQLKASVCVSDSVCVAEEAARCQNYDLAQPPLQVGQTHAAAT